jgi:hypothetical protein
VAEPLLVSTLTWTAWEVGQERATLKRATPGGLTAGGSLAVASLTVTHGRGSTRPHHVSHLRPPENVGSSWRVQKSGSEASRATVLYRPQLETVVQGVGEQSVEL